MVFLTRPVIHNKHRTTIVGGKLPTSMLNLQRRLRALKSALAQKSPVLETTPASKQAIRASGSAPWSRKTRVEKRANRRAKIDTNAARLAALRSRRATLGEVKVVEAAIQRTSRHYRGNFRAAQVSTMQNNRMAEGVYSSYWLGRFMNSFIRRGQKKAAHRHIYKALLIFKLHTGVAPLVTFLETLEQLKPAFRLSHWFPRNTAIIYPRVVTPWLRYRTALRWLVDDVASSESYASSRVKIPFWYQTLIKLVGWQSLKKHPLIKRRNKYHLDAIKLQENVRFSWKTK